jgi:NitT/TauT family transport system ATP-binding protein/nitrate/nitrite transport system substrate-binding protein
MKINFKIEKPQLNIGFMPLTDCAPIVVAKEMGIFSKWGLNVKLSKQNSWTTLRDKLHTGSVDAAQMLAPMPLASSLGIGCSQAKVITPFVLSRNGNGITISEKLYQTILSQHQLSHVSLPLPSKMLHKEIEQRKQAGKKLRFATVFLYSCHYYQLVTWLKNSQVDLDDIEIVVVPPSSMVAAMSSGDIDGFCVGGPWNAQAVREGHGLTGVTSSDIWPDSPEKVLGLLADWQVKHPETTMALVAALQEACSWLENVPNRFEAARILAKEEYLDTDIDVIAPSLLGSCLVYKNKMPRVVPSYNQFSAIDKKIGNSPELAYGEFLLKCMVESGHVTKEQADTLFVASVFRDDIFQAVTDIIEPRHARYVTLTLADSMLHQIG